ncbi:MAG: heavy metal-binding domain-containing protein [Planctomycetota bacterium]|nr:MAG: heavy metal-binding domain-containing protein [Planctomycetota bacterium]
MLQLFLQLFPILILIALGFGIGSLREWRHLQSLSRRERQYSDMIVRNVKQVPNPESVEQAGLVSGEAVIATDYFKSFAAGLRNIVGGEVKTYETLMARARREAIARMMEHARQIGASEVWNVRLETSNIRSGSGRRNPGVSVEAFAFGTAVVRKQS